MSEWKKCGACKIIGYYVRKFEEYFKDKIYYPWIHSENKKYYYI